VDFSQPFGNDVRQRFISRHRLEKRDPNAAVSEPVKPIVYYVDRGAPEPIRSALLEGAGWWSQAFDAAGFRNGFRVELMPEGADPMDVRYNVINWVHRSTRGWSYGASIAYVGSHLDLRDNFPFDIVRLKSYWLAGARVAYAVKPGVELYVRGSNLFNSHYEDSAGYRTEGFGLFAGIRLASQSPG